MLESMLSDAKLSSAPILNLVLTSVSSQFVCSHTSGVSTFNFPALFATQLFSPTKKRLLNLKEGPNNEELVRQHFTKFIKFL